MVVEKIISHTEEETKQLAKKMASYFKTGDILILSGELGSGKTKFVEGFLSYFGLENNISSPTFTIVNEYLSPKQKIFHFDLYRLSDIDEFYAMGGEEYFSSGICLIEWGEMIESILPTNYRKISFARSFEEDSLRELRIEFHGDTWIAINQ